MTLKLENAAGKKRKTQRIELSGGWPTYCCSQPDLLCKSHQTSCFVSLLCSTKFKVANGAKWVLSGYVTPAWDQDRAGRNKKISSNQKKKKKKGPSQVKASADMLPKLLCNFFVLSQKSFTWPRLQTLSQARVQNIPEQNAGHEQTSNNVRRITFTVTMIHFNI